MSEVLINEGTEMLKAAHEKVSAAIHALYFKDIINIKDVESIRKDLVGIQHRLTHEINLREV